MKQIPLELYVAINNADGARRMVSKYGLNPSADTRLLARQLRLLMKDDAARTKELAEIHPDKALFAVPEIKEVVKERESVSSACGCEHSNACGCSGFDGYSGCSGCGGTCGSSQATGGVDEGKEADKYMKYAPLVFAGIVLICFMAK